MSQSARNVDAAEIAKFEALAERWWDPKSEFRPLVAAWCRRAWLDWAQRLPALIWVRLRWQWPVCMRRRMALKLST